MAAVLRITFLCAIIVLLTDDALGASTTASASTGSGSALAQEDLPRRIGECRERCYRQSLPVITPPLLCRSRPECYMCHDYCRVLVAVQRSLATSMCADREFCTRGCRVACSYHRLRIFLALHQDTSANAVLKK
ncbi:hypothetical protein KR084_000712 [Drosophila pseudotakahashii]|nr:hypothetical protein KR084_000712 [Drosophila pseudotakahashii]